MSIEKRLSPLSRSARTLIKSPIGRRDFRCPTVARGPVPRNPYLSEAGSAGSGGFASAPAVLPRNPLQVREDLHVYRKPCFPVFKVCKDLIALSPRDIKTY